MLALYWRDVNKLLLVTNHKNYETATSLLKNKGIDAKEEQGSRVESDVYAVKRTAQKKEKFYSYVGEYVS